MNLVYERTDRIMVLEKVGSILSSHPPLMGQNCNCELCQHASEVGKQVRYSPKVARILAKGDDVSTSEYQYLIERGLTQKEIEKETGVTLTESGQSNEPLTLQRYELLKERGLKNREIAKLHGMSDSTLYRWKQMNNAIKIVIEGLDVELYKELKAKGFKDKEIAKRFKTNRGYLHIWKHQNLSKEEIQSTSQNRICKRRKEA